MKKFTILMLLVAMNLRLSVTAITPLFTVIRKYLAINNTVMALLVTIPLICFAVGSIVAPQLIQMLGIRTTLLVTTSLLVLANIIRPLNVMTLLLGTLIAGLAIALLNITVPTMIVQIAPNHPTRLTSYYSLTMNIIAAIGTATAIPIASRFNWQVVLILFAIPAIIAWFGTLLLAPKTHHIGNQQQSQNLVKLLSTFKHDPVARQLALFMGLQSLIFYTLTTWLPAIYQASGANSETAGMLLSLFQFVGVPASLLLNLLTSQRQILRWLLTGYGLGMALMAWSGIGWWLSAIVLGFTCVLMFSIALNLIATSSQDTATITSRSAIAQSLGYLLAAVGPIFIGQLQSLANTWIVPLIFLTILMGLTIFIGFKIAKT